MSGDSGARRLLPQSSQMQSFSFAPTNFGRENQKNYVFVDEHNRHKRLKVMRACEGCRRRKIKCDAATTNTWPCSACIRLKLHCVPPIVNYDREYPQNAQGYEPEPVGYGGHGGGEYQQMPMQQQYQPPPRALDQTYSQQIPYTDGVSMYATTQYAPMPGPQSTMPYGNLPPSGPLQNPYMPQQTYAPPPLQQGPPAVPQDPETPENYSATQDQYGEEDLAELLGDLKMDPTGSAPYLNKKSRKTAGEEQEPAFDALDDYKESLPPITTGPDLKIRIPPELMPDEETVMHYFDIYFNNVHPYVPVLNKTMFYQQWHTDRESISPLIIEAIFAIAGKLADEPAQGHQWLALVSKHLDAFMDVPRLSTLQAMLIILKAREAAPKRGYYYRSWTTVVECVTMAKDLGLDEHYEDHQEGKPCGSNLADCITKSRIWQTLFICELMIGSPQGRTENAVEPQTVLMDVPSRVPGDESEYHVTRNFTYFTRCVKGVRLMNTVYGRIKRNKAWALDPEFAKFNPMFSSWITELPQDLQITFPEDGSPPWLPSHFIGNLHSYYYLSIIMLHRPQLSFMDSSTAEWREHMLICYSSAKTLCRIQEAVLQAFGLTGLLCMQRGINFTIYCVLTCAVLHLVAITSPYPELNTDAREYFTRHMRILEKCISSWPMPDMQKKIDALREAFSENLSKPFKLRADFPYGSPRSHHSDGTPPRSGQSQYRQPVQTRTSSMDTAHMDSHHGLPQAQVSYITHPITPPISVGGMDSQSKNDTPGVQSMVMMAQGGQRTAQQPMMQPNMLPMVDTSTWNPTRIFDQWNNAFETPPSTTNQSPPIRTPASAVATTLPDIHTTSVGELPPGSQAMVSQQYSTANIPSFVTPSMWQESVSSVYEGGLKRGWQADDYASMDTKRYRSGM